VTIAFLDSKAQEAGVASAGDASNADDESITKDMAALLPMQTERLAYGQSYTTDATPHQSRIWARVSSVRYVLSVMNSYLTLNANRRAITPCNMEVNRIPMDIS
jgi:hypothetical protein